MKPCRFCAEPIKRIAVKCSHCGSAQNWQRHLSFFIAVSAALAAISTFVGFLMPPLTYALSPQAAIKITPVGANGEEYIVVVQNRGRTPAVFRYGHAWFPATPEMRTNSLGTTYFDLRLGSDHVYVAEQSTQVLRFYIADDRQQFVDPNHGFYDLSGQETCGIDLSFSINQSDYFYEVEHVVELDERKKCTDYYIDFVTGAVAVG